MIEARGAVGGVILFVLDNYNLSMISRLAFK
jgi:hypothetical protein